MAARVHPPPETIETVVPLTVQTPVVVELYVTGLLEAPPVASGEIANEAPALNVSGLVCAPKLIVWLACVSVTRTVPVVTR